jgi:transcription initiation factor TFIID subunit 1, fungi type
VSFSVGQSSSAPNATLRLVDDNRNKSGHRYNVAEQNKAYAQEVERIWRAQHQALSSKVEPELSEEDDGAGAATTSTNKLQAATLGIPVNRDTAADSPSTFSRASSVDYAHGGSHRLTRVLKIQRLVGKRRIRLRLYDADSV